MFSIVVMVMKYEHFVLYGYNLTVDCCELQLNLNKENRVLIEFPIINQVTIHLESSKLSGQRNSMHFPSKIIIIFIDSPSFAYHVYCLYNFHL